MVELLHDKMYKRISKGIKASDVMSILGLGGGKKKIFKEIHEKFGGSVRIFITEGAPQDPIVAKGLRDLGFNFIQGYGLTG